MANVLAIIPARAGSKGIPNKNFRGLSGDSPLVRACKCAWNAGINQVVITSDHPSDIKVITSAYHVTHVMRPTELAQDDTPMRAVTDHVLRTIPGPSDQVILLLQPTQPLRSIKWIKVALKLMEQLDCVVSVTPADSPESLFYLHGGTLKSWAGERIEQRQDCKATYKLDGTFYAWKRRDAYFDLHKAWPVIIPAEETCALDTPVDWQVAELRVRAQHTQPTGRPGTRVRKGSSPTRRLLGPTPK
jgi:CMP-N,N'-diacetyllegionaminic acid synthase